MFIRSKNRLELLFSVLAISWALVVSGCCAPGACGDCDGAGIDAGPVMLGGPLDGLRRMKRNLVCGSGCGETYVGEWRSTPPDACDPCERGDFVGGAKPCQPFCRPLINWRPGALASRLYGVRFCNGCGESFDSCGCGSHNTGSATSDCGCESVAGRSVARSTSVAQTQRPVIQQTQTQMRSQGQTQRRQAKTNPKTTISGRTVGR